MDKDDDSGGGSIKKSNYSLFKKELSNLIETAKRRFQIERLGSRSIFPGSYDASMHSILVAENQPVLQHNIVTLHEVFHSALATTHWGEVIRRIDQLGSIIACSLDYLRGIIITNLEHDSAVSEDQRERWLWSVVFDKEIRALIRTRLSSSKAFMQSLRFIANLEKRKPFLIRQWRLCQEGCAYWIPLNLMEDRLVQNSVEARSLCRELHSKYLKMKGYIGKAYRAVDEIATKWGGDNVFMVAEVCLSPDFRGVDFIGLPLRNLQSMVSSEVISPDKRMMKVVSLLSGTKKCPEVMELLKLLDVSNPDPYFSPSEFEQYWYMMGDSHEKYVKIYTNLLKELGLSESDVKLVDNRDSPSVQENKFDPIFLTTEGAVKEDSSNIPEAVDGNGKDAISRYYELSLVKHRLLSMGRDEGLI